MEFLPAELIRKKRFGGTHTREEIRFLIQEYSCDKIPDYQLAAWLMAVCWRGMSTLETTWLTQEMRDSGVSLDLKNLGVTVDKHSTGGVGDKTSLLLAPLVAAAGVPVPMMAGRSLGHTGGTLDKLQSIPGFSVNLSLEQFRQQVAHVGTAIIGQTLEMCPADRKLYALRDVTGTVDSLPLICGSIMSKKLAEGMSALVLDVKFGSGAFMKTQIEAEALAQALIDIGTHSQKKVIALLTRMDEPLGRFIGNALEVQECVDILDGKTAAGPGKSYHDTIELTLQLAGHMIFLGGKSASQMEGRRMAQGLLQDGSAKKKFLELCHAQGADLSKPLPTAAHKLDVHAEQDGFMEYTDVEKLGSTSVLLGAGRRFSTDAVDPAAGIEVMRGRGDKVSVGDVLFRLYAKQERLFGEALPHLRASYKVNPQSVPQSPLIAKVLL